MQKMQGKFVIFEPGDKIVILFAFCKHTRKKARIVSMSRSGDMQVLLDVDQKPFWISKNSSIVRHDFDWWLSVRGN